MDASYALSEIPEHATSAHDVAFAPGFADPFARHFDYADLLSDPVLEDRVAAWAFHLYYQEIYFKLPNK